jgi:hypothetical protein
MIEMIGPLVEQLRYEAEPYTRYKILVHVLGREAGSREARIIRDEIPDTVLVKTLLGERNPAGQIALHPGDRWRGAHWVLLCLADLHYPPGDRSLQPLMDQVWGWLLDESYLETAEARVVGGRYRCAASTDAAALFYATRLGLDDDRVEALAQRLLKWQWPDGGWSADLGAAVVNASPAESLMPMRALALHFRATGNESSGEAARRAAEVFLERRLCCSQGADRATSTAFTMLQYPAYANYAFLDGLKALGEAGLIGDPRCTEALDLLETKQLQGGGFPAERKHYRAGRSGRGGRSGDSMVDWGGTSKRRMNEFVTTDALQVLRAAGRLRLLGVR